MLLLTVRPSLTLIWEKLLFWIDAVNDAPRTEPFFVAV